MAQITSLETLKNLFASPEALVLDKVVSGLETHTQRFIESCPFAVLSTQNAQNQLDISPRGGEPGFIRVQDEVTLVLPEYAGNDRIDTLINLISNPQMGILCLVPGIGETLRLKGQAKVFTPDDAQFDGVFERMPKAIIQFKIETLYFQCAMALKVSKIWQSEMQVLRQQWPSIYQIIHDQAEAEKHRKSKLSR